MSKGRYFCGGSALAVTLALGVSGIASAQDRMQAFAQADANGDLSLSQEEVATLPEAMRQFARDTNGDGLVSMQEYLDQSATQADVTVDRVVTIGLISGASEQTAQPVEIIGREELEARGNPSMEAVIRDLSEVGNVQGQSARGTNAGGYGVSSINLRNMGSGRTLLTINGRRIADDPNTNGGGVNVTGGAQQNANAVPMEVLSQLEILKDGGGAQFGADAVAGVVNFVTRRDLDGFDIRTNYENYTGASSDGNWDFNVQWGKRRPDGEGDFLVSFFYGHTSALAVRDVDFIQETIGNIYSTNIFTPNFNPNLGAYYFVPAVPGNLADTTSRIEQARNLSLLTTLALRPTSTLTTTVGTALNASPFVVANTGNPLAGSAMNPVMSGTGLTRDDACIRLGGYRTFNGTGSPTCAFRMSDVENIVDEQNVFRVFGSANMNISDRFRYHGEALFNKTVITVSGLSLSYNLPCDPLPTAAPSGPQQGRACTSPAQAVGGYVVPGYNPAVRDYVLKFYNPADTARVLTNAQIIGITGADVPAGCTGQIANPTQGAICFNGGGDGSSYVNAAFGFADFDGTNPIVTGTVPAAGPGAGVAQGYVPTDGGGNITYGRMFLASGFWDPWTAMRNPAFESGSPTFQNQSQSFRTTQELKGDLGSLFGNTIDFTLGASYSRNITQLEGNSLLTDRLQRALNGFGTDLDNFGGDGCTALETTGARTFTDLAAVQETRPAGSTLVASDPSTASPFFGRAIWQGESIRGTPGSVDPDGVTGPLLPRRLVQNISSTTGQTAVTINVPYTVGAGGGAGDAEFGFNPGQHAGNGCYFFNPFASAIDVSKLNGESQLRPVDQRDIDVGFVSSTEGGFGGIQGDYQGYAPGLGLQNSPGLVRWLYQYRENRVQSDNIILDLVFNGVVDDYQLPGGDIQWAVGSQYRYVHRTASTTQLNDRRANPCPFIRRDGSDSLEVDDNIVNNTSTCGTGNQGVFSPTSGTLTTGFRETVTHALFGELSLPLHDRLNASLRYRYEEQKQPNATEFIGSSIVSGGFKYDINNNWAVAVDLSQTFDVPSLPDLDLDFRRASDFPNSNAFFTGTANNQLNPGTRTFTITNLALQPESGFNYTVRLLFQTRDRRVNASLDYFNITVSGRPETANSSTVGRILTNVRNFGGAPNVDAVIDCTNPNVQRLFNPAFAPPILNGPFVSYVDSTGEPVDVGGGCVANTTLRGLDRSFTIGAVDDPATTEFDESIDSNADGNAFNDPEDYGLYIRNVDRINSGTQQTSGIDFGLDYRVPQQIFGGNLSLSADVSWNLTLFNADVFLFGIPVTQSENNLGASAGGFAAQGNIWRGSMGAVYRRGRHQISLRGVYNGAVSDNAIQGLNSTATSGAFIPANSLLNLNPTDNSACEDPRGDGSFIPLPYLPMPISPVTGPTNNAGVPIFIQPSNTGAREDMAGNLVLVGEQNLNSNCNMPEPEGLKIRPWFAMSSTYRVQLPRNTTLSITVDNLLDSDPPYYRYQYGYNPYSSATPYGRTFRIGLQKRFQSGG